MVFLSSFNCWDIMNCDNFDCLARSEPKTPCWEIAKRVNAFQFLSDTCRDCIVYKHKEALSVLNLEQRELLKNTDKKHQICILQSQD